MSPPPLSDNTPVRSGGAALLAAVSQLGRDLVGALRPEQVADRLAATLHRLLRPNQLLIVLISENGARSIGHAHGIAHPTPNDGLIDVAMARGPTLVSTGTPEAFSVLGVTIPDPPACWLGTRFEADETLGAISMAAGSAERFDRDHLNLVAALASQTTIALQNTRLVSRVSTGKLEWEQTVDSLPQAICVVDRAGAVRRSNRAFAEFADLSLTAVPGAPCIALVPPAWAGTIEQLLGTLGAPQSRELRAGDRRVTLTVLPLGDARDGNAVLIFDDQTERRRLQDQLIQSEKMSAIGQLLAGVAHDLNNPLASVIGFADYLVEGNRAPPKLVEPLRAIQQEAERAAGIVKNLLTFARKQEHQRRVLPIDEILSATLLLLKNQLMASKVEARLKVDPHLPSVNVDANQMQQVVVNLISNAAHAIASSGRGGLIEVTAAAWLDGVAVTVADDGPGIPPDGAEKIFEPFYTTKSEGEGTGLGLSICQGIVKEHGGRISVTSSPLGGAAFRVELPAGATAAPQDPVPPEDAENLRILVVDDEPHIQHYMRATLESWGHTVACASDGEEGLRLATDDRFDVIISDLHMPRLGGREMYEKLSEHHPDTAARVVFSTGDTVRGNTLMFLESLDRPYLRKPFTLAELRAVLAGTAEEL